MTVTIETLDTQPSRDLFRGNGETDVMLWLNPDGERCGTEEWRDDFANGDYVRGTALHESIVYEGGNGNEYPDPKPLRKYIESAEGQKLLQAVCDGYSRDGERGELDDDAEAAWDTLIDHVTNKLPSTAWSVWDVEEWFNGNEGVDGTETDEQIQTMANEAESQIQDDQIINGDIYDYLIERRDYRRTQIETV